MVSEREMDALNDEVARYEQAAQDALEQLDWCIGYFHGVGKTSISAALARNRTEIRRLLRKPAEPTPSNPMAGVLAQRDRRSRADHDTSRRGAVHRVSQSGR
jgi:hypothetical protein